MAAGHRCLCPYWSARRGETMVCEETATYVVLDGVVVTAYRCTMHADQIAANVAGTPSAISVMTLRDYRRGARTAAVPS